MQQTQLRFFFFSYILTFLDGTTGWGNKFVKHPTVPPFEALDEQIKKDTTHDEANPIIGIFYVNWKELSMKDWLTATGQTAPKVQPAKAPLIKSLK